MKQLQMVRTGAPQGFFAKQVAMAAFAALLAAAPFQAAFALGAPSLGEAGSFAVLSGAAVTFTGTAITACSP